MSPEVTAEEWASMAEAASRPGTHYSSGGLKERLGSIGRNFKDRKILGRPLYEVAADFGAGFAVKTAVRAGVMMAGAGALGAIGAAVVAGAASGAVFAGGKEWFKQAKENWQQPLSPEAVTKRQKLLERVKDLNPSDWKKVGTVTIKGAVVGAVFGLAGGLFADALDAGSPNGDYTELTPQTIDSSGISDVSGAPPPIPDNADMPDASIPGLLPDTDAPDTGNPTDTTTAPGTTNEPSGQPETSSGPTANGNYTDAQPAAPDNPPPPPGATWTEGETSSSGPGTTVPSADTSSTIPPVDSVSDSINSLKDIPLAAGSNPWEVATEMLEQVNPDHVPSNGEIMELTKAICEQNDIGVPDWGISGSVDHQQIPIGYMLKIDPEIKSIMFNIIKGK